MRRPRQYGPSHCTLTAVGGADPTARSRACQRRLVARAGHWPRQRARYGLQGLSANSHSVPPGTSTRAHSSSNGCGSGAGRRAACCSMTSAQRFAGQRQRQRRSAGSPAEAGRRPRPAQAAAAMPRARQCRRQGRRGRPARARQGRTCRPACGPSPRARPPAGRLTGGAGEPGQRRHRVDGWSAGRAWSRISGEVRAHWPDDCADCSPIARCPGASPMRLLALPAFEDNYIWALVGRRRPRADRRSRARPRPVLAAADAGLQPAGDPADPPPPRPRRRRARAAASAGPTCRCIAPATTAHRHAPPRGSATGDRVEVAGWRLRRHRGPRPHAQPHRLPLAAGDRPAVLRRHAVQPGLRAPVRRHAGADAGLAGAPGGAARRHPGLLRPRVHPGQCGASPAPSTPTTRRCARRLEEAQAMRDAGRPTLPSRWPANALQSLPARRRAGGPRGAVARAWAGRPTTASRPSPNCGAGRTDSPHDVAARPGCCVARAGHAAWAVRPRPAGRRTRAAMAPAPSRSGRWRGDRLPPPAPRHAAGADATQRSATAWPTRSCEADASVRWRSHFATAPSDAGRPVRRCAAAVRLRGATRCARRTCRPNSR